MILMMDSIDNCLERYTKPYLDFCAISINTKVNRVLDVRFDAAENGTIEIVPEASIKAIIDLARDAKVAIVWFHDIDYEKSIHIKHLMKERTYTELEHDFGANTLCFGQYNFGGIY